MLNADQSEQSKKETGVIVEMIAPAEKGLHTDRKLINSVVAKHSGLKPSLKNRIFYAIGFNKREGNADGEPDLNQGVAKKGSTKINGTKYKYDKVQKRDYEKKSDDTFGYIENFLRWGSATWIWANLNSSDLARKQNKIGRPIRTNFPFRAWRELAHTTALGHWGAKKWLAGDERRDLIYKTADDDQDWSESEIENGLDAAAKAIGDSKGAKSIAPDTLNMPLVLTTPYHWSSTGASDLQESEDYKYQTFLDELNGYEVDKRKALYDKHPLKIYYPEPTTYFTRAAADIHPSKGDSVLEGAAKITSIVETVVQTATDDTTKDGTNATDVSVTNWKKMFKFLHDQKLTSAPGDRAKSLVDLYTAVKGLDNPERKGAIETGMGTSIDQSAFEDGYEDNVYKWNTQKK
ncbi:hypothetical protein [Pseudoalteromonas luteoviolacea]|uniref:hypothetical protein n=1 Tax=Pseudoalteromonas luteoviolacea TaxID=43657 RepID=UPI001B373313|nr:hypothetical protein [Pseudoalteromonas luteoviolacea]MBQ4837139.1 hypothetical protein [Pseudoalteromonas luteoviolacea]